MGKLKQIYNDLVEEYNALLEEYEQIKLQLEETPISIDTLYERVLMKIKLETLDNKLKLLEKSKDFVEDGINLPSYTTESDSQTLITRPKFTNNILSSKLKEGYEEISILSNKKALGEMFDSEMAFLKFNKKANNLLGFLLALVMSLLLTLIGSISAVNAFLIFCGSFSGLSFIFLKGIKSICKVHFDNSIEIFVKICEELGFSNDCEFLINLDLLEQLDKLIDKKRDELAGWEVVERAYQMNLEKCEENSKIPNNSQPLTPEDMIRRKIIADLHAEKNKLIVGPTVEVPNQYILK